MKRTRAPKQQHNKQHTHRLAPSAPSAAASQEREGRLYDCGEALALSDVEEEEEKKGGETGMEVVEEEGGGGLTTAGVQQRSSSLAALAAMAAADDGDVTGVIEAVMGAERRSVYA